MGSGTILSMGPRFSGVWGEPSTGWRRGGWKCAGGGGPCASWPQGERADHAEHQAAPSTGRGAAKQRVFCAVYGGQASALIERGT